MSNQPQLDPDALEAAAKELFLEEKNTAYVKYPEWDSPENVGKPGYIENARAAVSAYLAAALPEVTSVEEREEMPVETVLLDADGAVFQYLTVLNGPNGWYMMGSDQPEDCMMAFPARVLYRPEVKP